MKLHAHPKNQVIADGMPCIKRGGRLWMFDRVAAEYIGMTLPSYRNWVCVNRITRIKHGEYSLSPKDEIDRTTGAVDPSVSTPPAATVSGQR